MFTNRDCTLNWHTNVIMFLHVMDRHSILILCLLWCYENFVQKINQIQLELNWIEFFFLRVEHGGRLKLFLNDAQLYSLQKIVLRHAPKIFGCFYILVWKVRFQYIFHFTVFLYTTVAQLIKVFFVRGFTKITWEEKRENDKYSRFRIWKIFDIRKILIKNIKLHNFAIT